MAMCENCGLKGYDPRAMRAGKSQVGADILVGPCCSQGQQATQPQVEYGFELSSHYGLLAYATYGGLRVEYRKTPDQLRSLFTGRQQQNQQAQPPTEAAAVTFPTVAQA